MSSQQEPPRPADDKWRPTTKQIIAAVITAVALLAILQNTRTGHFSFLFFSFEAPVWIWLVVNFGAGFATGILVARHRARKAGTRDASA